MKWQERAEQLKQDIPALLLALKEKDTPWYAKALAALTVAYALSPIDLIPDFIPLLGMVDDILLLPALVALTLRLLPPPIIQRCRARVAADARLKKKWLYALPIILLWLLLLALLLRWLWPQPGLGLN